MITRDGFYVAFNKLKEMNELLDKISDGLDTDMSDSAVGDMLDNAFEMFIALLDGDEYLEEALAAYVEHIKSYDPEDKTYSDRGLKLLMKWLYSEEAEKTIDFEHIYSVEMAFKHSYANYKANPEATLLFYQPPMLSFEVRGKMEIIGEHHEIGTADPFSLPLIQQFINAQHDVYHLPNIERWVSRPAYKFTVEEIFDNSANKIGFGTRIPF